MRPVILTIDDAKAVRLLVEKILSPFDCETTEAANGFNGFFAIECARPDLIVLDLSMPVMNGVDMLERLKGTPELANIPVLMLPSRGDHEIIPQLPAMGAADLLMKPFTEAALLEKIRGLVKLRPRRL